MPPAVQCMLELVFVPYWEEPVHFNNVCHFSIHADDVLRAKTFYKRSLVAIRGVGTTDFF